MNPQTNSLPTGFAAIRMACRCFGVNMPELGKTLQEIRKKEADPDQYFPKKLNRVLLNNAEKKPVDHIEGLCTVARRALYSHIHYSFAKPFVGPTATLAENGALGLPHLYAEMLSSLRVGKTTEQRAFEVLIREVFLPTFFLELKKANYLNRNRGNELSVTECWYFPRKDRGQPEYPFPRVVEAWLNAAGFRYAEDVGKSLQSDSKRKVIRNWLKGKNVPDAKAIGKFVDSFQKDTNRFDDAGTWKGRLVFAAAMHRLCVSMDKYFSSLEPGFSFKLLGLLGEIEKECVPIDTDEILADRRTFFVARLIYQRLKDGSEWKSKIAAISKGKMVSVPDSANENEIEQSRQRLERDMNSGNFLLEYIKNEAEQLSIKNDEVLINPKPLPQQILELGIAEVNRLLT